MFTFFLNAIFPIRCIGQCGTWDQWICYTCLQDILQPGVKDNIYYTGLYQKNPILQKAIHEMKYGGKKEIAKQFGRILNQTVPIENYDIVIPVPLHKRRFIERGFNQSEVIASQLSLPVIHALQRTRYTTPQASLSRNERLNNLHGAFQINPILEIDLYDLRCLLVDDVYTTGSTINTCREILLYHGAQQVDSAVIAID